MKIKFKMSRKDLDKILRKNIVIIITMIILCPILCLSYARFVIEGDAFRSNEMYMAELLYSMKIDDNSGYRLTVPVGSELEEHVIEITSLNIVSSNYKLIYKNNPNVKIEYASDDWYLVYGNIIKVNKTHIRVTNLTEEEQTIEFNIVGGYYFNDVKDIKVPEGYTDFYEEYWYFDYETLALYVNNTRVEELDSSKYYDLVSYTCKNLNSELNNVIFDRDNQILNVPITKQAKCSLYFEEMDNPVYNFDYKGSEDVFVVPKDGYYKLEVWGAQGGSSGTALGGYGGYSKGVVYLKKDQTLYINVGGQGIAGTGSTSGGYNGGGQSTGSSDNGYYTGSGGGATHIALVSGILKDIPIVNGGVSPDILIVAAGGGGAGRRYESNYNSGGAGGGYIGNNGTQGQGATQIAVGSGQGGSATVAASFGQGAGRTGSGAGGGGGLYGGGASNNYASAGGGSSYIANPLLISYGNITKSMYCYNCAETPGDSILTISTSSHDADAKVNFAKEENGYARITYFGQIKEAEATIGYSKTYGCSKQEELFIVPKDGYYKLEVWGAQGGSSGTALGGYGGYTKGVVYLEKNQTLYINVGCAGTAGTGTSSGGYNGGGQSTGSSDNGYYTGSGGGATHIALVSGILKDIPIVNGGVSPDILIVAAGGGGAGRRYESNYNSGGAGGGYIGNNGTQGQGATQIAVGSGQGGSTTVAASFGQGAGRTGSGAGGGGGLYGGGASNNYASAGGGSSYIANPLLISYGNITKSMYCYNCTETSSTSTKTISTTSFSENPTEDYAKVGDGYAKVMYLGTTTSEEPNVGYKEEFECLKTEQKFIVPKDGYYRLDVWGAQGGSSGTALGGYGGYTKGVVYLGKNQTLYINVGCAGTAGTGTSSGGYNGGGQSTGSSGDGYYTGSGGGATHIATTSGLLTSHTSGPVGITRNLLIVAAGGGGAGRRYESNYNSGGAGGGYIGNNGTQGQGATQIAVGSGYTNSSTVAGSFGQGAGRTSYGAGGGGGLYGGGASVNYASAGGGSSYIGNPLLISYGNITKSMYCYNCKETSSTSTKTISTTSFSENPTEDYAKVGNGYAIVTYLGTATPEEPKTGYKEEFEYLGKEEEFIAPKTGYYKLEVWGAQGGSVNGIVGGYGSYSVGTIKLDKSDVLYVTVGSAGTGQTGASASSIAGGYNGGGKGYGYSTGYYSSGGGATHIAKSTGLLTTFESKLSDLIIVAGGGGGSSYYNSATTNGNGGSAGGYIGNTGKNTSTKVNGTGGTQSAGGTGATGTNINASAFGQGANRITQYGSGGGGGLYGGGASNNYGGAGGGSGYIGNSLLLNKTMYCFDCATSSDATTKTISNTCNNAYPTTNCSKQGNGYAKITYLGTSI